MQKLSISIAAAEPAVSTNCDGSKDADLSVTWDMNSATACKKLILLRDWDRNIHTY